MPHKRSSHKLNGFAASLLVLVITGSSYAQNPPIEIADPIIVSVSEKALPASAVSTTVTVVGPNEIESSRARNVGELLHRVPGLHISKAGGAGSRTSVSIRGGDPNFTLVLLDGVPVNDITDILGGSFDFSVLSTANIDRIEIVRGPLSSLYGSEAMSGVINIITRSGDDADSTFVSVAAGRFFAREILASHQRKWRQLTFSVGLSHTGSEEQVEGDAFRSENLNFRFDLNLGQDRRLQGTFALLHNDTNGFPGNGGGPLYSLARDSGTQESRRLTSSVTYSQPFRPWWNFTARMSLFDGRQELLIPTIFDRIPPGPFAQPSIDGDSNAQRGDAYVGNEWRVRSDLHVIAGAGIKRETGRGDNLIAERFPTHFSLIRSTPFVSGEALFSRGRFAAGFGFRGDYPSSARRNYAPSLGLTYTSSSKHLRLRTGLQWAYKLPSFVSLADPSIGNPQLRPEKNRSIDGGVNVYFGDGRTNLGVTVFNNRFTDLIDFSTEVFRLVNRDVVRANGVETELSTPLSEKLSVRAQATFISADIEGSTEKLRDRPRFRTSGGLEWKPTTRWRVLPEARWVSARADFQIPVPERDRAPGFFNADLVVDYMRAPFTIFMRAQNLTNREYEEFVGFPNPGIEVSVGISTHLTH